MVDFSRVDTAEIRQAVESLVPLKPEWGDGDALDIVAAAALKLCKYMEAGALIITPDEKTVTRIAKTMWESPTPNRTPFELAGYEMQKLYREEARKVLDALRDAIPDGKGE